MPAKKILIKDLKDQNLNLNETVFKLEISNKLKMQQAERDMAALRSTHNRDWYLVENLLNQIFKDMSEEFTWMAITDDTESRISRVHRNLTSIRKMINERKAQDAKQRTGSV